MPPQTAVTLYIYRVVRSCPARNPVTTWNSQGLLNSTRTWVHRSDRCGRCRIGYKTPHRSGQTVEGHRWCQPDRPCAKFGCEHMPPVFSKACCLKNNSKVDVTLHRPFFGVRAIFALNRSYPINHPARHLDEISSSTSHWEPLEVAILAKFPPCKNSYNKP
jgi:hypothetical protein